MEMGGIFKKQCKYFIVPFDKLRINLWAVGQARVLFLFVY